MEPLSVEHRGVVRGGDGGAAADFMACFASKAVQSARSLGTRPILLSNASRRTT